MKVMFLNNHGGGFADYVEVPEGTTVGQFFEMKMENESPSDYLIRRNRQVATADEVLQDGDRLSITPTKIEGA